MAGNWFLFTTLRNFGGCFNGSRLNSRACTYVYTHIGKDTDKKDWNTEAFARTDIFVVEDLAQFYTEIVSEKLKDRYPQINESYEKLLQHQSEPYLEHKNWLENKNRIGEVFRLALLQIRTTEETTI